ncbi:MAG: hypothetical protein ACLSV2_03965 [Clostridium sp.]
MNISELLLEYKKVTEDLIRIIEAEEYEVCGEKLLEEREVILSKLKLLNFDKEEFKRNFNEMDLANLDNKVYRLLNEERSKIKEELSNLKKQHTAVKTYGVSFKNINFINKDV